MDIGGKNYFYLDNIEFDSEFDSGSLAKAQKVGQEYWIYTSRDASKSSAKSWFYFRVKCRELRCLQLRIKSLGYHSKMLQEGLKPVFKDEGGKWGRIPEEVGSCKGELGLELFFEHQMTANVVYFALYYPYSYTDCQNFLCNLESVSYPFYFRRENLTSSFEGRRCDLLLISSFEDIKEDQGRVVSENKKAVVVSARVHAGETPSSYVMQAVVEFLLGNDPRAEALRNHFVFYIVPMLNPDGVSRGNLRLDTLGQDLNRTYNSTSPEKCPTIFALKNLLQELSQEIYCFIDLHAHASIKGIFTFGNLMKDFKQQIESALFPKFMELNSPNFHWKQCSFKDNTEQTDKPKNRVGTARTFGHLCTGIPRVYTLECNYNSGFKVNETYPSNLEESPYSDHKSYVYSNGPPLYDTEIFEETGKSVCVSILDMIDKNPFSRLKNSPFKDLETFKIHVAEQLAGIPPFRYYNTLRHLCKSKYSLKEILRGKVSVVLSSTENSK